MIGVRNTLQPETFVYRAIHAVAMTGLLTHLLLGCCLHHLHDPHPDGSQSAALAETCRPADPEGRDGHGRGGCCHGGQPTNRGCHEASCPFVRPDDRASASLLAGWQASAPRFGDTDQTDGRTPSGAALEVAGSGPFRPARPHLLYRVLLI